MTLRFATLFTTLLASSTAFAGVLTHSANIEFLAFDGKKISKSTKNIFNVSDNSTHQVVLRVSEIIRDGSDRSLFETDPIVLTFQGSDENVRISAPRLSDSRDAETFKRNPSIQVSTTSGKVLSTKQEYLKQEGFFPNANIQDNLSEYNASGATAAVPAFATTSLPTTVATIQNGKVQKGKVTVQGENAAEQMLQYWYQQADKETQQRFLNWVKSQK